MKKYMKFIISTLFLATILTGCGGNTTIDTAKTIEIGHNITLGEAVQTYLKRKGDEDIQWEYIEENQVIHAIGKTSGIVITVPTSVSGSVVSIYPTNISMSNGYELLRNVEDEIYKKQLDRLWKYKAPSGVIWTSKDFEDESFTSLFIYGSFPTKYKPSRTNIISKNIQKNFDLILHSRNPYYSSYNHSYSHDTYYGFQYKDDPKSFWDNIIITREYDEDSKESLIQATAYTVDGYYDRSYHHAKMFNITDKLLKVMDLYDQINMRGKYKEKN